ncbi:MAG: DUF3078 domain-containing protein [Porphyromonadaceae bacterium]|nr:DUF3078 domain-containing protein [Porphyromonadaceae bacterium]
MKKISLFALAIVFLGFSSNVAAQEDQTRSTVTNVVGNSTSTSSDLKKLKTDSLNWKFSGGVGLNSAFTMLSNWAAGGNNSALFLGNANLRLVYQKDKFAWETFFETELGYTYIDKATYAWRKSNDKINFTSKAGYDIGNNFYATLLGSFRSQYTKGYDYPNDSTQKYISNWLSPGYIDLSVGIDWKPNDIYSVYFSPAAGRVTAALDKNLRAIYGVDPLKTTKTEFGAMLKGGLNYQYQQFKVVSGLTFFTPYSNKFGNVDVDWDLALSYQLLSSVNISLGTSLKYYDAIKFDNGDGTGKVIQHIQFKTILGLGIGYTF